jgi:EmrB/QacA subfamily drug resistance transporter
MLGPHRLPCETRIAHETTGRTTDRVRWVLPATILGSSLSFIDGSVVNVALPAIGQDLGTSLTTLQWVVNGYMLTFASLILLGGSAGDRFGTRRMFLAGLTGFAAASLACAVAPSASWLIGARMVQGIAAALLTPSSLALIGAAYTGKARGQAIGTWAAAGALTTALGPPFGGWLVDTVGWRAIFLINLPLGAVALLLGLKLPVDRALKPDPLDTRGAGLATMALAAASYGLIALGAGQRAAGWIALAAFIPATWLFFRVEARSKAPMMPLELFRNRDFLGANLLTLFLYAGVIAAMFMLPFMLIEAHRYSAKAAGAAFLPFSGIMGAGSRWAGGLVERLGSRPPLLLGPSVTALGFVILGLSGGSASYWRGFLPGLCIVAVGMTLCVAPLTTTVFNSTPEGRSGTASGINNAVARVGGLLAVAALGLAFGNTGQSGVRGPALEMAYRVVMFAAAGLAGLSAFTAALTIGRRR